MVKFFDGNRHVIAFTHKGQAQDCCGRTPAAAMRLHDRIVSNKVKFGNVRDDYKLNSLSDMRVIKL